MALGTLRRMAVSAIIILLSAGLLFMVLGQFKLVTLTLIGIWGAVTYSTRPFIFAYRPFLGEWVSLFPSMLLLGLAAPWIMLDSVPLWAWQNAMINALWCMAWVMVHHIPDLNADRNAVPKKRTSVVWSIERYGLYRAGLPALIYLVLVFIIVMTMLSTRPIGAVGALLMLGYAIYLILSMDVKDIEQVTQREKVLLLLAMSTAVWLGIFY
ncbi:prenyltransferase [Salinicoccus sp. CNSTN-B1]